MQHYTLELWTRDAHDPKPYLVEFFEEERDLEALQHTYKSLLDLEKHRLGVLRSGTDCVVRREHRTVALVEIP